jgi:HEAT repeat protein
MLLSGARTGMWKERKRLIVLAAIAVALAGGLLVFHAWDDEASLIEQLHDGDPKERVEAVDGLGRLGSPSAAKAVAGAAKSEDRRLASHAVRALGRLGRLEDLRLIREAAKSQDEGVREAAVTAMGGFGDHADVDMLVGSLGDRHETDAVRTAAAQSLGRLDDYRAMPALIEALDDPSALVRGRAYASIRRILRLDVGFKARAPLAERRAKIERIRELAKNLESRHADYVRRMKERQR